MSTKTEALVVKEVRGQPVLETIYLGGIQPSEALIKIEATGICHSDLLLIEGTFPTEFPNVLGHEGAGTILEVGSALEGFSVGDKVLLSFNSCSECPECMTSHPAYCHSFAQLNMSGRRGDGSQPFTLPNGDKLFASFFGQSSFSKIAIVSGRSLVKVPALTDLALFSPLGCGVQTGVGTVLNILNVQKGQSLAIFGAGSVGLSALMAGKMLGANPIIAIDLHASRLQLSRELGATHTLLASDENVDIVKEIMSVCEPNGLAQALDCTGSKRVVEQMIQCLGPRGKAASVGIPSPGTTVQVDLMSHMSKGKQYMGSRLGDSEPQKLLPYLIEQHDKGNFPLDKIVKVYDGHDHAKAFEDVKEGRTIKAVLRW